MEESEKNELLVSEFWREKYEKDAQRNWDVFYKQHTNKFFRDRHWLHRDFFEALSLSTDEKKIVLEAGCGVGNSIFPLMKKYPNLHFIGIDFSKNAINLLKQDPLFEELKRCEAYVCDLTKDELNINNDYVDYVMLIYSLSAISPQNFDVVLQKLYKVLKPGGYLFFRDYGQGDLAQIKLSSKTLKPQKIEENFYVKGDGTRCYYFTEELVNDLMIRNGYKVINSRYHRVTLENKKLNMKMERVFVHGIYQKAN